MIDIQQIKILGNAKKLAKIGQIPGYDGGIIRIKTLPRKLINKVPFSSIHYTYKDYEDDLTSIFKYKDTIIPDELIERIYKTQVELGLDKLK